MVGERGMGRDLTSDDFEKLDKETIDKLTIDVYQHNIGYRTIFNSIKRRNGWLIGSMIFIIIMVSGYVITTYLDGTWIIPGDDRLGFFEDTTMITLLISMLLMLPTLRIFYNRLSSVFIKLCRNDIIDESKFSFEEYIEIVDESEKFISGKDRGRRYKLLFSGKRSMGFKGLGMFYFLGVVACIYICINPWIATDLPYLDTWGYPGHWITLVWHYFAIFLMWGYLIPTGLWHFMATILCLRRIITKLSDANAFKLRPLAPDGVAGLRPLGDLTLSMIYIIVVPMITVVSSFFFVDIGTRFYIIIPIYVSVVVIIFFLPLSTAHGVMAKAKEREFQMLSGEFNRAYDQFKKETETSKDSAAVTTEMTMAADYMDKVGSLYLHVEKMAVWPFDMTIVTKFLITILLPFIVIGVQIFLVYLGVI